MADGASAGTAGAEAAVTGANAAADAAGSGAPAADAGASAAVGTESSGAWAADAGARAAVDVGRSAGARAGCCGDALAGDGMAGRNGDVTATQSQARQSRNGCRHTVTDARLPT
jgi:hypothetical protein